ncbi:hypothetical protein SprV_0602150700 [Sparganum proliferum]
MTLNESKSPGPDDKPPKLLKEFVAELAKPLSMFLQASFEAGCLPAYWKSARIAPLYKQPSHYEQFRRKRNEASSAIRRSWKEYETRVMERAVDKPKVLFSYINSRLKNKETVLVLKRKINVDSKAEHLRRFFASVFTDETDFDEAGLSVGTTNEIIEKIDSMEKDVRKELLALKEGFLFDRSQTVHVGGQQSTEVAVESGVPQDSVLGPTLFIIYINDCVSELDCGVAMFADDIKLWSVIRTANDEEHLQANLNRLQQWSKDWLLPFNEKNAIFFESAEPALRTTWLTA